MAVYEKGMLLRCKDEAGNSYLLYPVTTLDYVEGAEDLLHYGAQELTDEEQAQARTNIGAIPAPTTAAVGQYIRVAAVDANGKITAIEAVDAPSGGGGGSSTVDGETLVLTNATVDGETLNFS